MHDSLRTSPASASLKETETLKRKYFRKDIQALRAFAVLAVVLNHLWPLRLTGGFIGVDIFFVISGFLISSHLLKNTLETGTVNLWQFYSRRIRRLLPAAFTVAAVSYLAVWWLLPLHLQPRNYWELFASTAYAENLYLFSQAVDYHAANQTATVAQHYWSLSVEEQFYFIWPLLLILIAALSKTNRRRVSVIFISVFTLGFFVFSLWFSHFSPHQAYFFTPVRFWEFGLGALVAIATPALRKPVVGKLNWLRTLLAASAWFLLLLSAWLITPTYLFPGWIALIPTLATATIIAVGTSGALPLLRFFTDFKPVQIIGDASYSIYLWHWPLIIITPYLIRDILHWKEKLALIPITILIGYLSKRLVEDKGLENQWFADSVKRTFIAMLAAILCFATVTFALNAHAKTGLAKAHQAFETALESGCVGPQALAPNSGCTNQLGLPISTSLAPEYDYTTLPTGCTETNHEVSPGMFYTSATCDFRVNGNTDSADTIYLIGDSHAQQWNATLTEIAKKHQKLLQIHTIPGCPVHDFRKFMTEAEAIAGSGHQCALGSAYILNKISADKPGTVLYSAYAKTEYLGNVTGEDLDNQAKFNRALGATWQTLADAGVKQTIVLADTPYNDSVRDVNCWNFAANPAVDCRVPRVQALGTDPLIPASQVSSIPSVKLLDLTDYFCDKEYCYAVAGQIPVYYDTTHVSTQYSRLLAPQIEAAIGLK